LLIYGSTLMNIGKILSGIWVKDHFRLFALSEEMMTEDKFVALKYHSAPLQRKLNHAMLQ